MNPGWPADPTQAGEPDRAALSRDWGTPVDPTKASVRPSAWETFKPVQDIFVPPGRTPSGWGVFDTSSRCPAAGKAAVSQLQAGLAPHRLLRSTSKLGRPLPRRTRALLGAFTGLGPSGFNEAVGGWLTDQNRQLVWYELAVNRAEFQYLTNPDGVAADALYTQAGQTTVATNANSRHPNGLYFPVGEPPKGTDVQTWDRLGATEVKAAWRVLTGLPSLWPRYHLTQAWVADPDTGKCTQAVLGLVGLHIIRNTATFRNFAWATFEHIDNAPDLAPAYTDPYTHPFGYSFNNPQCTGSKSNACKPNQPRVDGNGKPLFPRTEPVQVMREYAIPAQVAQLNLSVQQAIRANNSASVFQYYQLVNVLWGQSIAQPVTAPNQAPPLATQGMVSVGNSPVANTTLETYAQSRTCVSCHAYAHIKDNASLASDFSFVFGETQAGQSMDERVREKMQRGRTSDSR
ncbi:MAG: hypothetical protein JWM26_428 [Betaproteobacteria bacterium]|nr:hypothetical protein [Betaproteobacteria bacterium]